MPANVRTRWSRCRMSWLVPFECEKRSKKHSYAGDDTVEKVYGNYYATIFTFRTPGEHSAALTLLWGKDGGQWKILSYELVTP